MRSAVNERKGETITSAMTVVKVLPLEKYYNLNIANKKDHCPNSGQ